MSIAFRSSGNGIRPEATAAGDPDQRLGELEQGHVTVAAEVVDPPRGLVARCREQERGDGVVDVVEVAALAAVAVDDDLLVGERVPDPDAEEGLPGVPHAHPRAVGVRQPQHASSRIP